MTERICRTCKTFNNTRNIVTDALNSTQKWDHTNLTYYFNTTSNKTTSDGNTLINWTSSQKYNFRLAIKSWEAICPLTITESDDPNSDITLYICSDAVSYYGYAYFPDDSLAGDIYIFINNATNTDYVLGSFDYITLVHEFGHCLGLAHPHDTGGSSTIFPGVTNPFSLGSNSLNQTIYSVMSYNDVTAGAETADQVQDWGFIKGPMAFDIATINEMYTNDTIYKLSDTLAIGNAFECIYDTNGIDTIDASTINESVKINLQSAIIDNIPTGGGSISQVNNITGGYTISQNTIIENATGGSKNDILIGNSINNVLLGNNGNDVIYGMDGNDTINGGLGKNYMDGGKGDDIFIASSGKNRFDGNDGNDTVHFSGSITDYIKRKYVVRPKNIYWVFFGKNAFELSDGKSILYNIEYVKFNNDAPVLLKNITEDILVNL
jgi:Ca2+-binding RTX toxin-like protein